MTFPEYRFIPIDPFDQLLDEGKIAISGGDPGDLVVLDSESKINPALLNRRCFNQGVPSTVWNIQHNLGYKEPSVTVTDSAGTEVEGCVMYDDENNLRVLFNSPFSGKVCVG